MFGRNGNFTGNALLGQIVAESKPALKWTRDLSALARRDGLYASEVGIYAIGKRTDYLVTKIEDEYNGQRGGFLLTVNPGTYGERLFAFNTQREAKQEAAFIETS